MTVKQISMVFTGSFHLLVCSVSLSWVICHKEFCLYAVNISFCSPVFCPKLELYLTFSIWPFKHHVSAMARAPFNLNFHCGKIFSLLQEKMYI